MDDGWRATLRQALEHRDLEAARRVPKTDLHCHSMLSAPPETYAALLGRPLAPVPPVFGSFRAFGDYIGTHLFPAMTTPANVRTIIRAAFERMATDGVVYSEMSFDLLLPDFIGMQPAAFLTLVSEEVDRIAGRLTVAPEVGVSRGLPPDEAFARVKEWIASGVCRSIDLYDDERLGVLRDFAPLYRLAADHGLKLKAHAGELCGPDAVREAIDVLGVHAVQHGVRAAEDPAIAELLASRGTVLHICPTSNYSLGVCDALATHPARRLYDMGVRLTVNSDDFTLFGADVSQELLNLTTMGFTPDDVVQIVDNGLAEIPANVPTP